MDEHLPLTRPAPWTEIPEGMDTLFPEIASPAARPVQVTVTVPAQRCVMDLVVAEADAGQAFAMAFRECADLDGFKITVCRFPDDLAR